MSWHICVNLTVDSFHFTSAAGLILLKVAKVRIGLGMEVQCSPDVINLLKDFALPVSYFK